MGHQSSTTFPNNARFSRKSQVWFFLLEESVATLCFPPQVKYMPAPMIPLSQKYVQFKLISFSNLKICSSENPFTIRNVDQLIVQSTTSLDHRDVEATSRTSLVLRTFPVLQLASVHRYILLILCHVILVKAAICILPQSFSVSKTQMN